MFVIREDDSFDARDSYAKAKPEGDERLRALQKAIGGGYIEMAGHDPKGRFTVYCDEDGMSKYGSHTNDRARQLLVGIFKFRDRRFYGPVVIVGADEEPLSKDQLEALASACDILTTDIDKLLLRIIEVKHAKSLKLDE